MFLVISDTVYVTDSLDPQDWVFHPHDNNIWMRVDRNGLYRGANDRLAMAIDNIDRAYLDRFSVDDEYVTQISMMKKYIEQYVQCKDILNLKDLANLMEL